MSKNCYLDILANKHMEVTNRATFDFNYEAQCRWGRVKLATFDK